MNISDLIDQYEQGAKLRGLAPTQMNALKPVRRGLGHVALGKLTPTIAGHYVYDRRCGAWSNVHGHRPAANGTIRRELGALAAVLNWAHQKRILKDAPPSIDLPPMSPPRENFMMEGTVSAVWVHARAAALDPSHEHRKAGLFFCLAVDTWARAASIEELTWGRVSHGDPWRIDYRDPGRPETAKRRVPVPVSTRLATVLGHLVTEDTLNDALVVGPVSQYQWRRFCKWVDIDVTRHDLRRTGISLAVARGVDLMKIAQMAGDNYETVIRHYARFAPDYLNGVVE